MQFLCVFTQVVKLVQSYISVKTPVDIDNTTREMNEFHGR